MLTILLAAQDCGTAWRHLLAEGEARAGFECASPAQLVRRLGKLLGFPGDPADAPTRLAALAQRLDQHDDGSRSYSASRKADPFGVARFLLLLRDELRLAGWDGRALGGSARLRDLGALEALDGPLPPGLPDLVAALIRAIEGSGSLPIPLEVRLVSPDVAFPPLFRTLLDALSRAGVTVTRPDAPAPLAAEGTDLGRVQRALLDLAQAPALAGDGTFLLLEADTALEAAELAASLARTRELATATVVVSAEPTVLDTALARQGIPTLGLSTSSPLRPHLQVLPLRLLLAFKPQDPFRAAELLLLPGAPLAGHVKRRLLDALAEMPGIGSPAWSSAVADALAEEEQRAAADGLAPEACAAAAAALAERIERWFGGPLHDPVEGIPVHDAASRCTHVATWAGGRLKAALEAAEAGDEGAEEEAQLWSHASAVARTLAQLLVARPPQERLPQQTLMQLHDLAVGNGSDVAAFVGEAGRPAVARAPGAVISPCADVLWWGFVQGAELGPAPQPWTETERAALSSAGVALPSPGELRGVEASDWRRPLLQARERVALVRWRLAGSEPIAPHAFFDELETRVAPGSLAACTVTSERQLDGSSGRWKAATATLAPDAPMAQRAAWRVPAAAVTPEGRVSASSLECLLGCPFKWALEHQASLKPGHGVNLPEGARLLGDFAHRILQDMLCGPGKLPFARATEADASAFAREAFDARVALEAAPLVRRGGEVELDRARTLVADAAAALLRLLKEGGWRPVDAEREVTGTFAGQPASGYVDLVVEKGGAEALVDLKLSGLKYRRGELEEGRGLQIALYASMLGKRKGAALPPSGFFILSDGQLLTLSPGAFPGATVVEGPSDHETLKGAEEGFRYWKKVLGAGVLPTRVDGLPVDGAVTGAAGPPPDEASVAFRDPPCRFCDFSAICVAPGVEEEQP
jgi:hypothetical protein